VYERLREVGFTATIMDELRHVVEQLEEAGAADLAESRSEPSSSRR
jgi:hypothetical protein